MDSTLGEIAALLGGELTDASVATKRVRGVRSLALATGDDLAFFHGAARYLDEARGTRAAAIVCDARFDGAARPLIVVEDAGLATSFLLAAERDIQNPPPPPLVHPTAVVDPSARLEDGVSVGPLAVVEAGAQIGARSRIGAHAFVGRNARLGADCVLHPGSFVLHSCVIGARAVLWPGAVVGRDGFGFHQREGKHCRIPQVGGGTIGDDFELGCWSSVDRGAVDPTVIEDGVKVDSHCHIAHNCRIGENAILIGYARMGGSAKVGRGAVMAQDAALGTGRSIGDGGIAASGASCLYEDVKPGEKVLGWPARPAMKELRIQAITDKLPEMHAELRTLRRKVAEVEASIKAKA
jgi:UDP-3-O-[3-hydroxymyristoyl] glucosamine N-acyltransferase